MKIGGRTWRSGGIGRRTTSTGALPSRKGYSNQKVRPGSSPGFSTTENVKIMKRTGCIYKEFQRNIGKRESSGRGCMRRVRGVGLVASGRIRWVGEIHYCGKRYRMRSTSFSNVRSWLDGMVNKFN